MNKALLSAAAAAAFAMAGSAQATSVIDGKCVSVADAAGCLFLGNLNLNDNGNASYLLAEAAYNGYNDTHPSANPDIDLVPIFDTGENGFPAAFTGFGTASGTWSLPGELVSFVAVKTSNKFVLYQITPASSGSWDSFDIPYRNNPHAISHLLFFGDGTPIPEPATWIMLIGGFGLAGAALRSSRRRVSAA